MGCHFDGSYPNDQQGDAAGREHEKDMDSPSSVGVRLSAGDTIALIKPPSFGKRRNDSCLKSVLMLLLTP